MSYYDMALDFYRTGGDHGVYKQHPRVGDDYNQFGSPVLRWEDAVHIGCGGKSTPWLACDKCGAVLSSADVERRKD